MKLLSNKLCNFLVSCFFGFRTCNNLVVNYAFGFWHDNQFLKFSTFLGIIFMFEFILNYIFLLLSNIRLGYYNYTMWTW